MPTKTAGGGGSRPPAAPPRMPLASESGRRSGSSPASSSPAATAAAGMGPYQHSLRLLWVSQFISILGTEVSKFALRTWSYESTSAVTSFAWLIFLSELPAILLSPLTGAIVDRYNRKLLMMASDLTAGVATMMLCFLWQQGALGLHHVYVAVTVQAVCNSIQFPAFMATLSLLMADRKQELVKLNSVTQALSGVAMLLAPAISAGLLKTERGLSLVFAFDVSTLVLAVLVMLATRIPSTADVLVAVEKQGKGSSSDSQKKTSPVGVVAGQQQQQQQHQTAGQVVRKLWQDNVEAWRFLQQHPGLLALLFVVAQIQLSNGAFQILSTPIILSFAEPSAIAGVLTVSGVGAMLGFALPMALKGANVYRARTVLACVLLQGLVLLLLVVPKLSVVMGVAFLYMFLVPLSRSCREAIWMQKVSLDMQGRVFSLQHSISKAALPIAAVLSGPLADRLLQPLVDAKPWVAALAGKRSSDSGGGEGRGSALLALALGLANIACAVAAFVYAPYRALDEKPAAGEAWRHNE